MRTLTYNVNLSQNNNHIAKIKNKTVENPLAANCEQL